MDTKPKQVSFKLAKVTTEQFATIEDCFNVDKEINLEVNLKFAAREENRLISVFSEVKFSCEQKIFLIVEAGCHFTIEQESWNGLLSDSNIIGSKGVMQHLSVITVGTVRGILHAKTDNTPFNQFVMPTINVAEMIKEDVTINLST